MILLIAWFIIGAAVWVLRAGWLVNKIETMARNHPIADARPHWIPIVMTLGLVGHFLIWVPLWPIYLYGHFAK